MCRFHRNPIFPLAAFICSNGGIWNGFVETMEPVAFGRCDKPVGMRKALEWCINLGDLETYSRTIIRNTKGIFKWHYPDHMTPGSERMGSEQKNQTLQLG